MGGDTKALMLPNDTCIETISKAVKDKTDRIMRPTKNLVDSGTQEIFHMEPKKKFENKPDTLTTIAPKGTENEPEYKTLGMVNAKKKRKQNNYNSSNELGSTMNIMLCNIQH